jgi:hypothetical protein
MLKGVIGLRTFLFVAGSSLAYAQESSPPIPSMRVLRQLRDGVDPRPMEMCDETESDKH